MPELVGEDDLVHRREGPVLADRVQAPLPRALVVEARDVLLEDARAEGAEVGAGGQQVEGAEEPLVRPGLLHGVLVVEELAQVRGQLLPLQEVDGHVLAEGQPPRLRDLLLQPLAGHLRAAQQAPEEGVDEVRDLLRRPLLGRRLRDRAGGQEEGGEDEARRARHAVTSVRSPARKPRTV